MTTPAEISFTYPHSGSPHYTGEVEEAIKTYLRLLFEPDRLPEIVTPDFVELDQEGNVTLEGVGELQDYRRGFGELTLLNSKVIGVPADMAMPIPGGGGKRYDASVFFDEEFLHAVDGPLPPGSPVFPKGTPPVRTRIRMHKGLRFRMSPHPATGKSTLMVAQRSYEAAGTVSMVRPGGQHGFVVEQLWYQHRYNRSMSEARLLRPILNIMREDLPQAFPV